MVEVSGNSGELPNETASGLSDGLGEVCELKERVEELENRLRDIGDIAHGHQLPPEVVKTFVSNF